MRLSRAVLQKMSALSALEARAARHSLEWIGSSGYTLSHQQEIQRMASKPQSDLIVRPALPKDGPVCGEISYRAFSAINGAHNFPCDFPGPETSTALLSGMFSNPGLYCVVAEIEGRIVGSNVLDERSVIAGVGPLSVDPDVQNHGVGRKLMQVVMDRANERRAAGVRLVQAAFHNRSLSLYASLGFDVREPLSCVQGRPLERNIPGCVVRAAQSADLDACNLLSRQVHGFDRGAELAQGIQDKTAVVVERAGRITGYASGLAFFSHATAETNLDMQALLASAESFAGPGILLPSRNTALLRWCLANGLRVVQPMTLMSMGLYNQPAGAWFPSISF
jgi:predicted N-acetyltransferase YhbS